MPPLVPASMWTRKDVSQFKALVLKSKDSVIKVGSLATATVSDADVVAMDMEMAGQSLSPPPPPPHPPPHPPCPLPPDVNSATYRLGDISSRKLKSIAHVLTLQMPRRLSSKAKGHKDF